MKKYEVDCCLVRNTKSSVIEPASPYSIGRVGGNCVLMYSHKYSHDWENNI